MINMMLLKTLHIIFMTAWFAGLFYLPRLFVYHAMAEDKLSLDRFVIMERKLLYGIMTPSASFNCCFWYFSNLLLFAYLSRADMACIKIYISSYFNFLSYMVH